LLEPLLKVVLSDLSLAAGWASITSY